MTKTFYLTKIRFMHKHDNLSLTFQTLAIKTKPNQPTHQAALYRTVRTPRTPRTRSLQLYCRNYIHICTYVYTSGRPLLCWPCRLSVTVSHVTLGSLLHLPKVFNAVIIHLQDTGKRTSWTVAKMKKAKKQLASKGTCVLDTYLWPLFLNDIDYVICEVSLNDDLILPCYWGTAGEFLSKKSLCFFEINFCFSLFVLGKKKRART